MIAASLTARLRSSGMCGARIELMFVVFKWCPQYRPIDQGLWRVFGWRAQLPDAPTILCRDRAEGQAYHRGSFNSNASIGAEDPLGTLESATKSWLFRMTRMAGTPCIK